MIHDSTSYSGQCPAPLWKHLKEVSPADHQLQKTVNYAVALVVATHRYDELSSEEMRLVDHFLDDDSMPTPVRTGSGLDVDQLVDDLQSSTATQQHTGQQPTDDAFSHTSE